jgi:hypothetical protein
MAASVLWDGQDAAKTADPVPLATAFEADGASNGTSTGIEVVDFGHLDAEKQSPSWPVWSIEPMLISSPTAVDSLWELDKVNTTTPLPPNRIRNMLLGNFLAASDAQACRIAFSACVASLFTLYPETLLAPLGMDSRDASWILITAVLVQEVTVAEAIMKALARVLGTFSGGCLGWALGMPFYQASQAGLHAAHGALCLLVLAPAIWLWNARLKKVVPGVQRFPYAGLVGTLTLALTFVGTVSGEPGYALQRCMGIVVGVVIGGLSSLVVFPRTARATLKQLMSQQLFVLADCASVLAEKITKDSVEHGESSPRLAPTHMQYDYRNNTIHSSLGGVVSQLHGRGEDLVSFMKYEELSDWAGNRNAHQSLFKNAIRDTRRIAMLMLLLSPYLSIFYMDLPLSHHLANLLRAVGAILKKMAVNKCSSVLSSADFVLLRRSMARMAAAHAAFLSYNVPSLSETLMFRRESFDANNLSRNRESYTEAEIDHALELMHDPTRARLALASLSCTELLTRLLTRTEQLMNSIGSIARSCRSDETL